MTRRAHRFFALVSLLSLSLVGSCDRNTEDFVEGEKPRQPDLARIFPDSDDSAGGTGAGLGASRRGEAPVVAQVPEGTVSGSISGTISLAPGLAEAAPSQGMLFVIARPFGVTAGPPTAVLRIPSPQFPLPFEIGPDDVMIPSMRFEGEIGLSARLDADGNATSRQPGDLSGATASPLRPGARNVALLLDQKL